MPREFTVQFMDNNSQNLFYTFIVQEKFINAPNVYEHGIRGIKLVKQADHVRIN